MGVGVAHIACRGNCTAKAIHQMMASLAVHCPCFTGYQIVQRKQGCRVLQDTRPLMMTKGNAPRLMPLEMEVSARCNCPYTHILRTIAGLDIDTVDWLKMIDANTSLPGM